MLEQAINFVSANPGPAAFGLILFVLLICGLGVPLPEEIAIIAAAYLSYLGVINIHLAILLIMIAILGGDSGLYFVGHFLGNTIFEKKYFKNILTKRRMRKANVLFRKWGNGVVFFARFIVGVRGTVFLTAGILKMPYSRFIAFDSIAALIAIPPQMYLVYHFGDMIDDAVAKIHRAGHTVLVVSIVVVATTALGVFFYRKRKIRSRQRSKPSKI